MRATAILLATALASVGVVGCCGMGSKGTEKYMCKSKQEEGKSQLKALLAAANAAKASAGQYPKTIADAQFAPTGLKYYDLSILSANATNFSAEAKGKGDMAGDDWKIDETGKLSNPADKCAE